MGLFLFLSTFKQGKKINGLLSLPPPLILNIKKYFTLILLGLRVNFSGLASSNCGFFHRRIEIKSFLRIKVYFPVWSVGVNTGQSSHSYQVKNIDPFYIINYYIELVKTSWACSRRLKISIKLGQNDQEQEDENLHEIYNTK